MKKQLFENYIVQNSAYPNIFHCYSNDGNEILDMDTIKNYNFQMKSANWNTFEQYEECAFGSGK